MNVTPARRALIQNFGAHLSGIYGSKALDLLVLMAVSRKLPIDVLGTVFLAEAAGGAVFRILDFGLYPVLVRRAARNETGRSLLAWATSFRALGVVVLTGIFAAVVAWQLPERAALATAFFFFGGVYVVHEVPRAVIAGRERFALTAKTGVILKAIEASCTIPGVWLGLGVWPWVVGRSISQLGMLAVLYVLSRRMLPDDVVAKPIGLVREGLPFWLATVLSAVLFRLDTFLVSAYLGLSATGYFGIATRVIGGSMSAMNSLLVVAYPSLAREGRRFITPAQVTVVTVISLGLGAVLFVGAPLAVRVVTGTFQEDAISVVRTLSPVITLAAIGSSLETWLQAKNKERSLAAVALVSALFSAAVLLVLVPRAGMQGAAYSRVLRTALDVAATGVIFAIALRGVTAPWIWLVSKIPFMTGLIRSRLRAHVQAIAKRLAAHRAVTRVDVAGSADEPERFQPGISDLDFAIGTSAAHAELDEAVRHCEKVSRASNLLGRVNCSIADERVLRWARQLGNPVLRNVRSLIGNADIPAPDEGHAKAWALTHAVWKAVRLQAGAVEEGRYDGGARAAFIAKQFRFLLRRLSDDPIALLDELGRQGFELPRELSSAEAPRRLWFTPLETATVLAASQHLIRRACGARATELGDERCPGRAPNWLAAVAERSKQRIDRFAAELSPDAIQLTPTGPTNADPMLIIAARDWTAEQWLSWSRVASSDGPLPMPFRAYRWPVVLPPEALSADAFIEHSPLFHLARGDFGLDLRGSPPRGRTPPAEFARQAALRETVLALVRLPYDMSRVARSGPTFDVASQELGDGRDHWRFRVHAYVTGRLPALSLLLDSGEAPSDPAEVRAAYVARYDDELSRLLVRDMQGVDGPAIASALRAWYEGRIRRVAQAFNESHPVSKQGRIESTMT